METASRTRQGVWNPVFISVFITNICINMGQQMMNTLIPKFADYLGATASVIGTVTSMFAVTALAIRPFSGPAFDSFSKKRLLMIAVADIFLSFLIYSVAQSVPLLIIARLIQGLGVGCVSPLCLAMAGDSLPENAMGRGIGIFTLAQAVAQAIGPNIGLSLCDKIGYNYTFAVGACVMAAAFVVSCLMKEPNSDMPRLPYRITFNRMIAKEAIPSSLLLLFLGMAFSCISSFLAIYGALRGVKEIGLYFTVYAGMLLLTRPIAGNITDRFGFDKVIVPGICFFGISFLIISFSQTLVSFLIAGAVGAFGYGACQPAIQALSIKRVPKEKRGAGTSTNYMCMDIGMLCGPLLSGYIIEACLGLGMEEVAAYSSMYRLMLIPMGISLLYFLLTKKKLFGL